MSVEATFVLFECDDCAANIGLSTDDAWEAFEATWHAGSFYQFCPKCKIKQGNQSRISLDKNYDNFLSNLAEQPEYIN